MANIKTKLISKRDNFHNISDALLHGVPVVLRAIDGLLVSEYGLVSARGMGDNARSLDVLVPQVGDVLRDTGCTPLRRLWW